jgi:hypothetical protein
MEDASGVDLDWFWRGWFFSTEHVDVAIDGVKLFQIDSGDPDEAAERKRKDRDEREETLSEQRNADLPKRIDWQPGLKDFYNSPEYDEGKVEEAARKSFQKYLDGLDDQQRALLRRTTNFYVVSFRNAGGLVMPILLRVHYADDSSELLHFPAQVWRKDSTRVDKLLVTDKEITRLELDPKKQTADTEESNNHWPPRLVPSRFKLFKQSKGKNPMQKAAANGKPAKKVEAKPKPQDDDAAKKEGEE